MLCYIIVCYISYDSIVYHVIVHHSIYYMTLHYIVLSYIMIGRSRAARDALRVGSAAAHPWLQAGVHLGNHLDFQHNLELHPSGKICLNQFKSVSEIIVGGYGLSFVH